MDYLPSAPQGAKEPRGDKQKELFPETPEWSDAPTCEGWWWVAAIRRGEHIVSDLQVAHVFRDRDELVATLRRTAADQCGDLRQIDASEARWYGPIQPPEVPRG